MTSSIPAGLLRAGFAALLATGGALAVGGPARAADSADLDLVPSSFVLAKGVKEAKAKPFKFTVRNLGPATAADVKVTIDVSGLTRKVGYVEPDGCDIDGKVWTCTLDRLNGKPDVPAGTSEEFGVPLYSTGGAGDGGTLKVTVASATADPDDGNNVVELDVPVVKASYDLSTWTQDVYADVVVDGDDLGEKDLKPVAPGATAPLDWVVYNAGRRRAEGLFYTVGLPAGVTFAKLPDGCEKRDVGDLDVYDCVVPDVVLKPGQFYTDAIEVKVDPSVTGSVLTPGVVTAFGLNDVAVSDPEGPGGPVREGRTATSKQQKMFTELDEFDNTSIYDVFVNRVPGSDPGPSPSGTPSTGPGGGDGGDGGAGGGEGGLPVTGAQAGLIGGVGLAVVAAGGVLFLLARRRRIVLVSPGDEKPGA